MGLQHTGSGFESCRDQWWRQKEEQPMLIASVLSPMCIPQRENTRAFSVATKWLCAQCRQYFKIDVHKQYFRHQNNSWSVFLSCKDRVTDNAAKHG